jgi:hypothetical protein
MDLGHHCLAAKRLACGPDRREVLSLFGASVVLSRGLHYRHDNDHDGTPLCFHVFNDE